MDIYICIYYIFLDSSKSCKFYAFFLSVNQQLYVLQQLYVCYSFSSCHLFLTTCSIYSAWLSAKCFYQATVLSRCPTVISALILFDEYGFIQGEIVQQKLSVLFYSQVSFMYVYLLSIHVLLKASYVSRFSHVLLFTCCIYIYSVVFSIVSQ